MDNHTHYATPASIKQFWRWFAAAGDRLFFFENNQESVFNALAGELARVDRDLTFEFGPPMNDRRDFVISAGGIKRAFDSVQKLVAAAPQSPRWNIIAFRPRRVIGNVIEIGDVRIDPKRVQYSLLSSKTAIGLHLFIPGYIERDTRFGQAGFLLLDEALGEYDVETKVGLIKMHPPEEKIEGPRYPINQLPKQFDEVYARLAKTSH